MSVVARAAVRERVAVQWRAQAAQAARSPAELQVAPLLRVAELASGSAHAAAADSGSTQAGGCSMGAVLVGYRRAADWCRVLAGKESNEHA
jgi:hypothetical protein